jgi:hypothetical protein
MKPRKTMKDGRTLVLAVALLGLTATAVNAQSGPFVPMAGAWSGDGRVVLSDGQVERIRCRATDDVGNGGELMRQHLRCASPSYNFDVRNTVSAHQGRITGNWTKQPEMLADRFSEMHRPTWFGPGSRGASLPPM